MELLLAKQKDNTEGRLANYPPEPVETTRSSLQKGESMLCPVCFKGCLNSHSVSIHLCRNADLDHQIFVRLQEQKAVEAFEKGITSTKLIEMPDFFFSSEWARNVWIKAFGKDTVDKRARMLMKDTIIQIAKSTRHQQLVKRLALEHSEYLKELYRTGQLKPYERTREIKNRMSRTRLEGLQSGKIVTHNKGKTKEEYGPLAKMSNTRIAKFLDGTYEIPSNCGSGIGGFRRDLKHYTRSILEANICRIFIAAGKRYLYEPKRFKLVLSDKTIKGFVPDLCDIDGFIGVPGDLVEIKAFLSKTFVLKHKLFVEQYPDKNLHILMKESQIYKILEEKYKPKIPLWETREFNILTHPKIFGVEDIVRPVQRCTEVSRNANPLDLDGILNQVLKQQSDSSIQNVPAEQSVYLGRTRICGSYAHKTRYQRNSSRPAREAQIGLDCV